MAPPKIKRNNANRRGKVRFIAYALCAVAFCFFNVLYLRSSNSPAILEIDSSQKLEPDNAPAILEIDSSPKLEPDNAPAILEIDASPKHGPVNAPAILEIFHGAPDPNNVTSKLANRVEGTTKWCQDILLEMDDVPYRQHRKQWEFCFMAHALDHFGKLKEGSKGLGFAVGQEPLGTFFVKKGVELTVSDMPVDDNLAEGWNKTGQHAAALKTTFRKGVISYEAYAAKAKFVPIDMNNIPEEILKGEYDFAYSSSSLEHVGSVELGREFILNSMKALKKGGIGMHTTEFAINSLTDGGEFGHMSVWLKKDVDILAKKLTEIGCRLLPMDYSIDNILDVDQIPYSPSNHFILQLGKTIHTSIAFIIEKLED